MYNILINYYKGKQLNKKTNCTKKNKLIYISTIAVSIFNILFNRYILCMVKINFPK